MLCPRIFLFLLISPLLGIFYSCSPDQPKAIPFSANPYTGQSLSEAWEGSESLYFNGKSFNAGVTATPWWIKMHLEVPESNERNYYLRLNNPHINYLYVYFDGATEPIFVLGDKLPFSVRPVNFSDFIIPLDLSENGSKSILLLVNKAGETLQLRPELLDQKTFEKVIASEALVAGGAIGWLLVIFVFAVVFAVDKKEWSAIIYAIYTLSVLLWIISHWGLGFQYLWPNDIEWAGKSRPFFNMVANLSLLMIIMLFFPPLKKFNWLSNTIWFIIWVQGWLALDIVVKSDMVATVTQKMTLIYLVFGLSFIVSILIITYLILQLLSGHNLVKYYLAGIMFVALFAVLVHLYQSGITLGLPHYFLTFGSSIGVLVETSLITIAFAKRASMAEKEKEALTVQMLVREKSIADQMVSVQEAERNRLGRDLHDGIGGLLASMYVKIGQMTGSSNVSMHELNQLKGLVKEGMDEARSISHDLTPSHLEDLGIEKVLKNYIGLMAVKGNFKYNIYFNVAQRLETSLQLKIYRICTELVHNIAKHAKASEVMLQVIQSGSDLEIIVEDNGKGIDQAATSSGIGLKNIRDRVDYLKGKMHMDSNSNGTTFIINLPIS